MGSEKRERKKANRGAKLAAEQAEEARRRRNRFIRNALIMAVGIIIVGFLLSLAACSDDDGGEGGNGGGGPGQEASTGEGECPPADGVDEPVIDFDAAPPSCIDADKTYTATVETTEGTVTVELSSETPVTTNNFVALSRWGYYDGTDLFRTEANTGIIQGGSPHTQSAADPGPGYTIQDEGLPYTSDDYGAGTLAMARTSEPDSAGAQFFFLATDGGRYLGDPSQLGPSAGTYVPFGTVTEGLDVLEAIAALDDGGGAPSSPVSIESVTIAES